MAQGTAVASMFQNGISRNTKCVERDCFRREGHIYSYSWYVGRHKKIGLCAYKIWP